MRTVYFLAGLAPLVALGCSSTAKDPAVGSGGHSTSGGSASGSAPTSGGASANGGSANPGAGTSTTTSGGQAPGAGGGSTTTAGGATTTAGGANTAGGATTTAGGSANPAGGSASNLGGSASAQGGAANTSGGSSTAGGATGSLVDRIGVSDVTVPAGVKAGVRNYRIWGATMLKVAPVYAAPLANCGTLVCFTTGTASAPNARVAKLDGNDKLQQVFDLGAGLECRGLAAEPDGHFAALLWSDSTDKIFVKLYDIAVVAGCSRELENSDNHPTYFGIGESRLEFGANKYGAYYHVHSDSGHEGDTLKWVDLTGTETTGWSWGCSHSMSNLLSFHPTSSTFMPACVTDCYPGTTGSDFATQSLGGIYLNHNKKKVMDVAAGCNGSVAGELGGAAPAATGWKLVFNAHQTPAGLGQSSYNKTSMNQDIGWVSVAADLTPSAVVWLTTSAAVNEADSAIARWQPLGETAEQYVVGWSEPGTATVYKLARADATGKFLEGPLDVTAKAHWGQRDDPFRQHKNQDVVWAWFEAAGSTTLKVGRLRSGGTAQCASF